MWVKVAKGTTKERRGARGREGARSKGGGRGVDESGPRVGGREGGDAGRRE